ncbi:hypothetical protein Gotur_027797, partial [Gossypium turneri]
MCQSCGITLVLVCFTLIMGTYRIYLILGWMNNCFGPLLNIGTLHIAVLLFGRVDLVPTVEKYTALLRCPRFQVDEAYSRAAHVPAFWKKLMNITRMSEQWITARIKQKGECKCIPWKNLRDLILAHPDGKKKV